MRTNATILNIGGGEIILIAVLLVFLGICALGFFGIIYLIIRAVVNRPAQPPPSLPQEILIQNQQTRDREHLKLLSIFHFVVAGLALIGIGFVFVHYFFMHTLFSNPEMWKNQGNAVPPPKAFLDAFIWMYLFFGVVAALAFLLNLLSAIFLLQKRNRIFSMVIGGLDCLQIPFGTVLGVFTIMVLSRESVRELYCRAEKAGEPKGVRVP